MTDGVVDVQVAGMMGIDDGRLAFEHNTFDGPSDIEEINAVDPIVRKAEKSRV